MQPLSTEQVMASLVRLPSLPAAVLHILGAFEADEPDVDFLVGEIGQDQALSARVLRLANSSFYGLQSRVDSIHDAIVVLGMRHVRATVSMVAVTACFVDLDLPGFDFRVFWRHCTAVGLAARGLARLRQRPVEAAFTAGLLHDLGLLVLVSSFPEAMARVFEFARAQHCGLVAAEHAVIGIDHGLVGKALAERWKFPQSICDALGAHHTPDEETLDGLAGVTHVADALVKAIGITDAVNEHVPPVSELAMNRLELSVPELKAVMAEVEHSLEETCQALFD